MTSTSRRGVDSISEAYEQQQPQPRTRRSLLPPFRRKPAPDAEADSALDLALQRLADATEQNEGAAREVKRRQSSGSLKIVSDPPPAQK